MSDEERIVYRNRYREARKAGLHRENAGVFAASTTNIGWLRLMAKAKCDPDLIVRTLL